MAWFRALVVLVVTSCLPHSARCPPGHDLRTGIRRDGRYECWPHPVAPRHWDWRQGPIEDWDGTYGRPERSIQPARVRVGRIYCTGGAQPVVVNERTVGCQR